MLHRLFKAGILFMTALWVCAGTASHHREHLESSPAELNGKQRLVRADRSQAEMAASASSVSRSIAVDSDGKQELAQSKDPAPVHPLSSSHKVASDGSHHEVADPYFRFWGKVAKIEPRKSLVERPKTTKKYDSQEEEDLIDPNIHMPSNEPYNLTHGSHGHSYSRWSQDAIIQPMLEHVLDGGHDAFYVESGARDGENGSDTLLYELQGKWSGLLVEPDPRDFERLQFKHRKAYAFHGCLSPTNKTEVVTMYLGPNQWGVGHIDEGGYTVTAAPLQTLLKALERKTVDFWSLAVEGSEAAVLNATNFTEVEVGVLLVEMDRDPYINDDIRAVMVRNRFRNAGHIMDGNRLFGHIFINPDYFRARNLTEPPSDRVETDDMVSARIAGGKHAGWTT